MTQKQLSNNVKDQITTERQQIYSSNWE